MSGDVCALQQFSRVSLLGPQIVWPTFVLVVCNCLNLGCFLKYNQAVLALLTVAKNNVHPPFHNKYMLAWSPSTCCKLLTATGSKSVCWQEFKTWILTPLLHWLCTSNNVEKLADWLIGTISEAMKIVFFQSIADQMGARRSTHMGNTTFESAVHKIS